MSNEKFTQLPTVTSALAGDIICAVQGGVSVQETLQQVLNLVLSETILNFAGNPNGNVAGTIYQLCWDTTNHILYICTTTGSTTTAVWTAVAPGMGSVITPTDGGTGVSNPTAHTLPVAEGASNFHFLGPLTNGQILIGNTGSDPTPATLTAGTGMSISNAGGSITLNVTGSGAFSWTVVSGTTQTMAANNGYIPNNGGLVTLTMPGTASVGDEIDVIGHGAGGWTIAQPAGVTINLGSSATTGGVGGSLSSTNANDAVALICTVANTNWAAYSVIGNITVV